ncbi:MAG: NlpC/P60 family protein [Gemmatimonadota bacterium]
MASGALSSFHPEAVPGFPAGSTAVVRVAWSPLRREPSHRSEMVNQVVLGELVRVGEDSAVQGWVEVTAADGYPGHVNTGALVAVTDDDASRWAKLADGFSLGLRLESASDAPGDSERGLGSARDQGPTRVGPAPWGARLPAPLDGGTVLPDGRRVIVADGTGRLLAPAERRERYPADPGSASRTALTWMGSPYVWGGRIRSGTDCSGLVQSVFALHGIPLPRDSRQQAEVGQGTVAVDEAVSEPWKSALPGDLLFFAWGGRPISHVGICLGDGEMVHSSETRGGVAVDGLGRGEFGRRLADGYAGAVRPGG